jgi:hypothetical protein
MLVDEIIATCSHPLIAGAALLSIGGDFQDEVQAAAQMTDMRPDAFLASVVRHFGAVASPENRRALSFSVKGHDTPLLEGLRLIFKQSCVCE